MLPDSKPWYQSKTLWFNIASLVVALTALPEFGALVPAEAVALIAVLGNLALRLLTDQPLSARPEAALADVPERCATCPAPACDDCPEYLAGPLEPRDG